MMLNLKPYHGTLGSNLQCCARARCERSVESLLNFRRAVPARRKHYEYATILFSCYHGKEENSAGQV